MPISAQEKYLRLREKLKNPIFYKEYQKKRLIRQREYARDPEYCKKRALSTADWRFRKLRGLPTRPRVLITSKTQTNFEFTLVPSISVEFC